MHITRNTMYQQPRNSRREDYAASGRSKTAKLLPIAAVAVKPNEGGVAEQTLNIEMEDVPRRLLNQVRASVNVVYVPAIAAKKVLEPESETAGYIEAYRDQAATFEALFPLEQETELTKRMGINPISIAGQKKLTSMLRMSVIAGINYLRQRRYIDATLLDNTFTGVSPAILSETAMERFRGVLDPDDRVNGTFDLGGQIAVDGIARHDETMATHASDPADPEQFVEHDGEVHQYSHFVGTHTGKPYNFHVKTDSQGRPQLSVNLSKGEGFSLSDLYDARRIDALTRQFDAHLRANPEYGEEQILHMAAGLSIDMGKTPYLIFGREYDLNAPVTSAMDGPSLGDINTVPNGTINYTLPIPKTEFGGVIVTYLSILPDERVKNQPHPIFSKPWAHDNHVAEQFRIDPEPVKMRELNSDILEAEEETVAFYTGHNRLQRTYQTYGFTRWMQEQGEHEVDNKSAVFMYDIPLSTDPDNILYDENYVNEYPFQNGVTEVVSYQVRSTANFKTPTFFGPDPVETNDILDDEEIFGERDDHIEASAPTVDPTEG